MKIHHVLCGVCEGEFSGILDGKPRVYYDGLEVKFIDGSTLLVRYSPRNEYSFHWTRGDDSFRIDTAPLHKSLGTFPNHFHDSKGRVKKDDVTDPRNPPEENLRRVMRLVADKLKDSVSLSPEDKHSQEERKNNPCPQG
jgi:hypothetical protein